MDKYKVLLKHVTFAKGYNDKDTLKDFVKIRHYFDLFEENERKLNPRRNKKYTEKELDEGISVEMANPNMAYFLIFVGKKDIGFTSVRLYPYLEIITLYIDKQYRGKGYGTATLNRLERFLLESKKSKVKDIEIVVNRYNIKAHKLYKSLGYNDYKKDIDFIYMIKKYNTSSLLNTIALKHVVFTDWHDTMMIYDFMKIRRYFDKLYEQDKSKNGDPEYKDYTEEQLDQGISTEMKDDNMAYFLLYYNLTDFGFASVRLHPKLQIVAIYIDDAYRNKGYGTLVFKLLENYLLMNGKAKSKDIEIRTGVYNIKAQKLYANLGYIEYKRDKYHVYMRKHI